MTRIVARADRLQRRHGVLGFPYAVIRKFLDDGGAREAALITYYGFLSIFPILLLGVAVLSEVLAQRPDLRQQLVEAMVPPALAADVTAAAGALPGSGPALVAGLIGLVFSGTGVVFSAYRTLNHVAAVPFRLRSGLVSYILRVTAVLVLILAGAVTIGGLTVVIAVFPGTPRVLATLGSALVVLVVLLLTARVLLDRPAPMAALWPAALPGAVTVTLMLHLGAVLLPALVRRAGAVYGSFATVAGMFTLLYLLSLALVCAAEIAAVRRARLWPRSVDGGRPTEADARALTLLARERELLPGQRIESRLWPGPDEG
ncbi:MAG TPA: YhjD/YihY/BrkB family envelope integrity protein [Actinoplanes sp.]|nr:YhjD/YihY/BrkB family envelope integrity protein [Actinoplanes sp.]